MSLLDELQVSFNGHATFKEKRPGILQVFAPLFHEDGDMIDIFLDLPINGSQTLRISDHGLTLMRLSYSYEIDTPNKRRIFDRIVAEIKSTNIKGFFIWTRIWDLCTPQS